MSHVAPDGVGQSTQIEHPWRAMFRTVGLYIVIAVPLLNVGLGIVLDELTKAGVESPEWLTLGINGVIVGTGVAIAVVQRLIVLPGFNALLTKIGLGPVAK